MRSISFLDMLSNISEEDIRLFIEKYRGFGPLPGILLPLLESFLPILPIFFIVLVNAQVYGLGLGFLFSWLGITIGSYSIFLIARTLGKKLNVYLQKKYSTKHKPKFLIKHKHRIQKASQIFHWIEKRGFSVIFILACLPFAPTFLVNVVAGLSEVSKRTFFIATCLGKAFMSFLVSLVGYDILSVAENPWKLILTTSLLFIIWIVGKRLEMRFA
ncbi:TVP38/TMEM64 family protein [Chengkuizengella axinellae]|uniref:TVP38/TMEM64 family membrane protein n=1 Tax=Chengkuizengella axinellae TaxID=3064388 RepID=A0ABT9J517_9BACL|nr:TVP38/TMEM64 family protein [Chengkuizengella sp. 2205SS18-9]MDP5276684.1 TVP38/TMEM64 family protein [Chengkuizengella sp. 2205SS18-9]